MAELPCEYLGRPCACTVCARSLCGVCEDCAVMAICELRAERDGWLARFQESVTQLEAQRQYRAGLESACRAFVAQHDRDGGSWYPAPPDPRPPCACRLCADARRALAEEG